MHILTPKQFIEKAVFDYPALYASSSFKDSSFRVLDHVLNTIGNGIEYANFTKPQLTVEQSKEVQKWFNCKRAAYGYTKTRKLQNHEDDIVYPCGESIVVPNSEKDDHPEIVYWVDFECDRPTSPYPNFTKRYSMVFKDNDFDFKDLGKEWIDAAISYYEQCREFFTDPNKVDNYHESFPRCPNHRDTHLLEARIKKLVELYKQGLKHYSSNEEISNAYKCEFVGDVNCDSDIASFIEKRWDKELDRILKFIEDTIIHLKS